jgi:hypothetical protein
MQLHRIYSFRKAEAEILFLKINFRLKYRLLNNQGHQPI